MWAPSLPTWHRSVARHRRGLELPELDVASWLLLSPQLTPDGSSGVVWWPFFCLSLAEHGLPASTAPILCLAEGLPWQVQSCFINR